MMEEGIGHKEHKEHREVNLADNRQRLRVDAVARRFPVRRYGRSRSLQGGCYMSGGEIPIFFGDRVYLGRLEISAHKARRHKGEG